MRTLPDELQSRLNNGVTTLCHCWIVRRRDGDIAGFTDHDRDLIIDGVTCRADSGLSGSEATHRFGLAVEATEIAGALNDDSLRESDLAAGRYDAAQVESWLVDWSDPSLAVLLSKAVLGEVTREGSSFKAELRGLADALAQENGRMMTAHCAADLGDARCKTNLATPSLSGTGAVDALQGISAFIATGLNTFASGHFSAGRLTWQSGANAGLSVEIKTHKLSGADVVLTLWQAMPEPISPGDEFAVNAGCDKRFSTCRARFSNSINFRGFPHMPGNDFVMRYPNSGEPGNNGASLQSEGA